MGVVRKSVVLAALAVTLGAPSAFAQFDRGPQVNRKDVDPVIGNAADTMGLVRTRQLVIGQINLPRYEAKGTMVDLEAATPGQPLQVTRYAYSMAFYFPAAREEIEAGNLKISRVVKGTRAWDETWTADKKKINTTPADKVAAFRAQMMWFQPHNWLQAAALYNTKKDIQGKATTATATIAKENGKDTVEITINGVAYKGTMGPDKRPESIEATITLPDGSKKKMVSRFYDWRAGEKPDAGYSQALGANALDQFHNGTYFPSRITRDLDGQRVMDITLTAGFGNPYIIFPEPELLAKGQ
ncbi:MAG: hypothetical protein U1E56_13625 [Bauldia sp.]